MIEVEKKFQPTEEQLAAFLKDCTFVKEVKLHDLYYDYPDYRLWKKQIFLRNRNNGYELKVRVKNTEAYEEIEDEEGIKKHLQINVPLSEFIEQNFIKAMEFKTIRKKYQKDQFNIDVDELDFGYKCIEIEILVEDESQIAEANENIQKLVEGYGFYLRKAPPKRGEYFRLKKPELYKELYGDK